MTKTLVIVLGETRAHELTFDSFKKNVIDELNADLCVCIGVKKTYDYNNPFYKLAKHRFLYDEPEDFGFAFEYAYDIISENKPKYECLPNVNGLFGKLASPKSPTENIVYYGDVECLEDLLLEDYDDDMIAVHMNDFPDELWKNQVYGIKKCGENCQDLVCQSDVVTYKKPLYWREFLKIQDQYLGGIKDMYYQHPGSAGILIFFRWFLLENLKENNLIDTYDRFIITRSDFIYQLPHPKMEYMDENNIWIPDSEHYQGYTDRHVVLSKNTIEPYLNILNNMVLKSNLYFMQLRQKCWWNLEQIIKFHLEQNKVLHLVKEYPYVMYSVRNINGTTRFSEGVFNEELGYYVKYKTEYEKSSHYKKQYEKSGLSLEDFYRNLIM